jgi:hypothetical protein
VTKNFWGTPISTNTSTAKLTPYQQKRFSDLQSQVNSYTGSGPTVTPPLTLQTNQVAPSMGVDPLGEASNQPAGVPFVPGEQQALSNLSSVLGNPAGGTSDTVRVQRPDGRYGRIPKSQLQEAVQSGYKIAE